MHTLSTKRACAIAVLAAASVAVGCAPMGTYQAGGYYYGMGIGPGNGQPAYLPGAGVTPEYATAATTHTTVAALPSVGEPRSVRSRHHVAHRPHSTRMMLHAPEPIQVSLTPSATHLREPMALAPRPYAGLVGRLTLHTP